MNYRLLFSYLLLIISFIAISPSYASQYGPTYPSIWGYDLSELPAMQWGQGDIKAYLMEDGDIWFVVNSFYQETDLMKDKPKKINEKYILIKFFKGEQYEMSEKEKKQLLNKSPLKNTQKIIFKDHSTFTFFESQKITPYFIPDFCKNYFIKTSSKGDQKKYSILIASPQVEIYEDKIHNNTQYPPFIYQRLHLLNTLIPLKDDTFLIFDSTRSLILRLDKNLQTQFKAIHPVMLISNQYIMRNFFIIDYSIIENLITQFLKHPEPIYQGVHNALFLYFHEKYPESLNKKSD